VWLLAWTLTSFHRRRGHLREDLAAWQAALAAAEHLPDAAARTRAHRLLGVAHAEVGSFEDAATHLEFSLARAGADQNSLEQAHTHFQLAAVWDAQGDDKQALHHATCALNLYRALGQPVWEAQALNSVGWCAASLGDYASAREHCRAALDLHREHGHVEGQAQTLDSLGYIDHCTGCHEQALDRYGQALDLYRALDDDFECANTLDHLGAAYAALGRTDRARAAWREAFELYQARHRLADADRMRRRLDTAG
jgi:tetratricopeptide (TPR) repeat protein